jgi:hypothetical protein
MAKRVEFPPPWELSGSGVIILFPANKKRVLDLGFLQPEDAAAYRGGLGAVMLVRYEKAPCGPYDELLYIPGLFEYRGKSYHRISKIFVSSKESVEWGRRNWAIPKELAVFDWQQSEHGWRIDVHEPGSGAMIYSVSLTPRFFAFPLTTVIFPWSLLQKQEEQYTEGSSFYMETKPSGSGSGKIAFIDRIESSHQFPDYHDVSHGPRIAIAVSPFEMTFPIAKIIHA